MVKNMICLVDTDCISTILDIFEWNNSTVIQLHIQISQGGV